MGEAFSGLQRVTLAAVLHDIGKFWQRSGEPPPYETRELKAALEELGREEYGGHGAHAKWSLGVVHELPESWRTVGFHVLFHHNPQGCREYRYEAKLVTLADWLSSGERNDTDESPQGIVQQLLSPFSYLDPEPQQDRSRERWYYPLTPLRFDTGVFPAEQALSPSESRKAYQELWHRFKRDHSQLPRDSFEGYLRSLLYLLQKYAWCVPSAYFGALPDISLYEHLRTTAAIAACLYLSKIAEEEIDEALSRSPAQEPPDSPVFRRPRFSLLAGDITGVQRFLYTITSKAAARGLRGRSFYMTLLAETVSEWLLRRLGLPPTNLLYSGGGHFYILSPFVSEEGLRELRKELAARMAQLHQGDLYVALGASALCIADLWQAGKAGLSHFWREAGQKATEDKRRKFAELPSDQLETLFEPKGKGEEACVVCRREPAQERPEREGERWCDFCHSLTQLGAELRDADYLLVEEVPEQRHLRPQAPWYEGLRAFGVNVRALGSAELARTPVKGRAVLLRLGDPHFITDEALAFAKGRDCALGFTFLGKATPHQRDGQVADFQELAQASQGVKRVGILRMDVDDLGLLFTRGLGNKDTISRMATLSFLLRLYFEGYLNTLCAEYLDPAAEKGLVYLIYSGGDDLFLVGSWNTLVDLAQRIRDKFDRFVCRNPKVHLSAGLVLEDAKFPLYQGAEHAKQALDQRAKRRSKNGKIAKNAMDFLGATLGWEEFHEVVSRKDALLALMEKENAPRALLHLLQRLSRRREAGGRRANPDRVAFGPWHWMAAYMLTRMRERMEKGSPEARQGLEALKHDLLTGPGILYVGVAARWAELLLRKEGTE